MYYRQNLIAFWTILNKEVMRFSRIWIQTLLPPAVNSFLYMVIFGQLIGSRVGDMNGYAYMDYIVPGIIMMTVITNSYANVVSSFYSTKYQHSIEELLVSPVYNIVILSGYVMGGVCRGMLVGFVVALVSTLFSDLVVHNYIMTFGIMFSTSVLFATGGFINAVYARSFDDVTIIPSFVLAPLIYLGGIFYSIQMLPPFWQTISMMNPVLYMINGFRYGILGEADISIYLAFTVIIGFIILLGSWAMLLLNKGIGIKQ